MKDYLAKVDTRTDGTRNDVTPLFADHAAFSALVRDLAGPFTGGGVDCVACIDALGFILGTAIAHSLGVGVIPVRKGGKLPVATVSAGFTDYSGTAKQLEIRRDAIAPGMKVLLVDEWIETGAQVGAAAGLIESLAGVVAGIATINMDTNDATRELARKYRVHSVWRDGDG